MLPSRPRRISSSEGFALCFSRLQAVMIIPGVQKPHCRPCSSQKPVWIGCSLSPRASPSMVMTLPPSAWAAKIVQDLTASPFSTTVHAPHWLVSQPMWVPVRPSVSRRKWTSRSLGSTSRCWLLPLTVSVTERLAMHASLVRQDDTPRASAAGRRDRGRERPAGVDLSEVTAVIGRSMYVAEEGDALGRALGRPGDRLAARRLTAQRGLDLRRPHGPLAGAGDADRDVGDPSAVEADDRRDADDRVARGR